ncbi:hypothetical protein GCM10010987_76240 [Bradyrhizobium guangdongense]|uniref:Uncharacterized protein n=1 Tax=Bradyrhizobium guangdongense TaxID=1325090 RepID=A0AA87WBY7_9BRAD|nr:hypothetical protein GCM10010987_76240 [Bradyrhizobium guangdongense]
MPWNQPFKGMVAAVCSFKFATLLNSGVDRKSHGMPKASARSRIALNKSCRAGLRPQKPPNGLKKSVTAV